ncbi:hypothetical protein Taro_017283 [Colocasia esculenta]|uniref:Uncharacterized protein n=1 Tax=Colocasia esculenta TaxID=4460 RepID=A0A843UFW7_COLES|nr:hypothetical protein [Colocasia esculenta]
MSSVEMSAIVSGGCKRLPTAGSPFGGVPRTCLGHNFAMIEAKMCSMYGSSVIGLARFLRVFSLIERARLLL